MLHSEHRQHKRYLTEGKVLVRTVGGQFVAELVDLGKAGALLLAGGDFVKVGEEIDVHLAIRNYPVAIETRGRVIRIDSNAIGIVFVDPPVELDKSILWLESGFLSALF